ncbi:MAG TPA: twin-arginine translocase TatA/TatE family subunit [Lacipirellulaceae bacterium]|jgi:sec-independent protein translocase protein TatA|nr:twin-arginine translocase TatA/TatE family subunit [Lacipirellulaceae bacterium]
MECRGRLHTATNPCSFGEVGMGGEFSLIHWVILLGIVLLLFGGRLPSLARSLGQSIVEFKKGVKEIEDHSDDQNRHS